MVDHLESRIAKCPRPLVALGMAGVLEAVLFLVSGVWDAGGHDVLPLFWHMPSLFLCFIIGAALPDWIEASLPDWGFLPVLFLGQVLFYFAVFWAALALRTRWRAKKRGGGEPTP